MPEFEATIERFDNNGAGLVVPFNVQEVFGTKAQVRVKCTIDGHPYQGALAPYGGKHYRGIRKDFREAIGKKVGDRVEVVMERDAEPRVIETLDDFQQALDQHPDAKAKYEGMSYTHRKEYVEWIVSAKKPETRANRIEKADK